MTPTTDHEYQLSTDVMIVPVRSLGDTLRVRLLNFQEDYIVSRPGVRAPSQLVESAAAAFLEEFRLPSSIVDAVLRHSLSHALDPFSLLERAYPLIRQLLTSRMLIPARDTERASVQPLIIGDTFLGHQVVRCIQSLEDTAVFQLRGATGRLYALKIASGELSPQTAAAFSTEAAVLLRLKGQGAPTLHNYNTYRDHPFLLMDWCSGEASNRAAYELRRPWTEHSQDRLLDLTIRIAERYVALHSQGVIHGDIHPRNILVQPDSEVTLVDFGLAQLEIAGALNQTPTRAGMPFYFEPECVAASLAGKPLPPATRQSEQYALAALLFSLLTGRFYIEFSLDSWEASIQILQEEPRSFASCGLAPWPELEWVLAHALSKDPAARFASMSEFVEAMRRVCRPPIRVRPHRAPRQF